MGTRITISDDRSLTDADYAALRFLHTAYVEAVDNMRKQTQRELAETLRLPVERVKSMWWTSGCT